MSLCNPLLEEVKENNSDDFYCFISDKVALCLNGLAVSYGNRTKRFKESISILKNALNFSAEADTYELIEDNIKIYRKNLGLPIYGDSRLNDLRDDFDEKNRKKSLRRFLLIAIILVIFSPLLTPFLTIIAFIILINFYKSEIITFLEDLGK